MAENMLVRFIPTDVYKGKWTGNKPALCFKLNDKKARCVVIHEEEIATVDLPFEVVKDSHIIHDPQGSEIPYDPKRFVKFVTEKIHKPLSPEARILLESMNGKKVTLPADPPRKISLTGARPTTTPLKTAGAELIITLSREVKLSPQKLRRFLRSQGLRAPYTDEVALRKTMKKLKKVKAA